MVDGWFDAAFVGGDWPRSDLDQAYPHFSAGAARDAERDAGLMSNARYGERLDSVEATDGGCASTYSPCTTGRSA